jgi:hypothetical protein
VAVAVAVAVVVVVVVAVAVAVAVAAVLVVVVAVLVVVVAAVQVLLLVLGADVHPELAVVLEGCSAVGLLFPSSGRRPMPSPRSPERWPRQPLPQRFAQHYLRA